MTYQTTFQRVEKKYSLTPSQYARFLDGILIHMDLDQYGEHTICNLYYDTQDYRIIRTSLEKPVYKEKLRLRSYGIPASLDSTVFLELKKKYKGIVYKRRISLPLREAEQYLEHGIYPSQDSQILREIDWFLQRERPDTCVFLAYDRCAYFDRDNPELRLTVDENIRWRGDHLRLGDGDQGALLQHPGKRLVEIKIPGSMPVWLSRLLSDLQIYPTSFSKYGTCYVQCLCRQKGGSICA